MNRRINIEHYKLKFLFVCIHSISRIVNAKALCEVKEPRKNFAKAMRFSEGFLIVWVSATMLSLNVPRTFCSPRQGLFFFEISLHAYVIWLRTLHWRIIRMCYVKIICNAIRMHLPWIFENLQSIQVTGLPSVCFGIIILDNAFLDVSFFNVFVEVQHTSAHSIG